MVVQSFEALKRWAPENPDVNLSRDVARLQPKLFDLIDRVQEMSPEFIHSFSSPDAAVSGFTISVTVPRYPESVVSVSIGYRVEAQKPSKEHTVYEVRVASDDNRRLNHMFEQFVLWPRRIRHGMRQFPVEYIRESELSILKQSDEEVQHLKNLVRDVKKLLDAGHTPSKIL